jgi:hypothetical protein
MFAIKEEWGIRSFSGVGIVFGCLEFFGCLEIYVGDWRKAVSRMAAPRGFAFDHR